MMCGRLSILVSLVLVLGVMAGMAQAVMVVTTENGNGADTYVTNDDQGPTTTHGGETRMRAFRQVVDSRCKIGYIRFDLTGAEESDISGTMLTFEASVLKGSAKTVKVYGLTDETLDPWVESTTCYKDALGTFAPGMMEATLGNYALDLTKLTLLGTITTPAIPSPVVYPVRFSSNPTDLPLASFINADTNKLVTFVFIGTNNEGEIATKEHATYLAPTLTLIPEPATIALLGLGGLSLLRIRKRR